MTTPRTLIIGGGTMGGALATQLVATKHLRASTLTVVEHRPATQRKLRRLRGVTVASSVSASQRARAQLIILAVKPQDAAAAFVQLQPIPTRSLIISIMAGVSRATLVRGLKHRRVIRAMPNLPLTVGVGMTAWVATAACTAADRRLAASLFSAFGQALELLSDDAIDRVTAISGSGPGYVFAFADDLVAAARSLGFSASAADQLVRQTLLGAATLLARSSDEPSTLVRRVASKGGTTEAALAVLNETKVRQAWIRAVRQAYRRARTLARNPDNSNLDTRVSHR